MMSFRLTPGPYDVMVEKATNDKSTSEDWGLIMEICDKVGSSQQNAKECLRSICKRLSAHDPHIVMLAITLLDACSSNCGKAFHLEIASREFETQFIKFLNSNRQHPKVYEKLKALLKKWAEGDFKTDPQLNLIPSLYQKLMADGHDFSSLSEMPKPSYAITNNPNVVSSTQEAEEIARAIELSLKENTKQSAISHSLPSSKKTTSLYPSVNSAMTASSNSEGRKVKALYDFEAVEDNELTFTAGEIINILDDSDPNWWKGSNQRGEGLFPSNFVTADLTVEPEQFTKLESNSKKSVQFSEESEEKPVKKEPEVVEVEIDEQKMDRLLGLLHESDPYSDSKDSQEILDLEEQVTAMGPLIDTALEKVDKQHAQLTQLSSDLVDAMNLYHTLMREPAISSYTLPKMPLQQMVYPYPHPQSVYLQGVNPQGHLPVGHPQGHFPAGHLQGHPQAGHPQGHAPIHPQAGQPLGHPQAGHPQGHPPGHPQAGHPQGHAPVHPQGHPQAGHPQGHAPAHPQGQQGHPQAGHPQGHAPAHPQGQQGHPQAGHPQGHAPVHPQGPIQGHPQGAPPQGVSPQSAPPQGVSAHMFNGLPSGPQSHIMTGPQLRFNTNMPSTGELINTSQGPTSLPNMTLPHHFQMATGLRQVPPEARQDSQQPNQNNIPYTPQGFPAQSGSTVPTTFLTQVPTGQQISAQYPQFAPPNSQRLM